MRNENKFTMEMTPYQMTLYRHELMQEFREQNPGLLERDQDKYWEGCRQYISQRTKNIILKLVKKNR